MKYLFAIFTSLFLFNTASADFSDALLQFHPFSPEGRPFIIDIKGEWPTDCHPGEQKPVISEYTGDTVLIEFETIVEHVTCNDVATPYRVLVDMSDVIDGTQTSPLNIEITIRYDGTEYTETRPLNCICSPSRSPNSEPESGSYYSAELDKQGLFLSRQNSRLAAYPLIFDEAGSSEWLFAGDGIEEEVYFTELYELTGGQCLGCAAPDDPPEMNVVGKISMLMDSDGVIQVKVNDDLFRQYEQLVFGHASFEIWDPSQEVHVNVPSLGGRWAFQEAASVDAYVTPPPTTVLPLVFDIKSRDKVNPPPPTIGTPPPLPPEGARSVLYGVADMNNQLVAELLCDHDGELVCELRSPDSAEVTELFDVQIQSLNKLKMTNTATPDQGDSAGSGVVVRID